MSSLAETQINVICVYTAILIEFSKSFDTLPLEIASVTVAFFVVAINLE